MIITKQELDNESNWDNDKFKHIDDDKYHIYRLDDMIYLEKAIVFKNTYGVHLKQVDGISEDQELTKFPIYLAQCEIIVCRHKHGNFYFPATSKLELNEIFKELNYTPWFEFNKPPTFEAKIKNVEDIKLPEKRLEPVTITQQDIEDEKNWTSWGMYKDIPYNIHKSKYGVIHLRGAFEWIVDGEQVDIPLLENMIQCKQVLTKFPVTISPLKIPVSKDYTCTAPGVIKIDKQERKYIPYLLPYFRTIVNTQIAKWNDSKLLPKILMSNALIGTPNQSDKETPLVPEKKR